MQLPKQMAATLACFVIAACATPTMQGEVTYSTEPAPGAIVESEIGEALFTSTVARTVPGITFPTGTIYVGGLANYEYELFAPFVISADGNSFCGSVLPLRSSFGEQPASQQPVNNACFSSEWFDENVPLAEHTLVTIRTADYFQRQLIYTGRNGSSITILYREFMGDMVRPAFDQELTFDISDDNVVGMRGARLRIHEATNVSITYEVIRGFSDG